MVPFLAEPKQYALGVQMKSENERQNEILFWISSGVYMLNFSQSPFPILSI